MDDKEFVEKFGAIYASIMKIRKNEDYIVNSDQMDKFLDLVQFFISKANELGDAHVQVANIEPKERNGGLTATFLLFDIAGDDVPRFCDVLRCCSCVTIDADTDGNARISCTVPNVFIHKDFESAKKLILD